MISSTKEPDWEVEEPQRMPMTKLEVASRTAEPEFPDLAEISKLIWSGRPSCPRW